MENNPIVTVSSRAHPAAPHYLLLSIPTARFRSTAMSTPQLEWRVWSMLVMDVVGKLRLQVLWP